MDSTDIAFGLSFIKETDKTVREDLGTIVSRLILGSLLCAIVN